ncbi:MAG: CsgG/HfaB family protein [bacterium]
MKHKMLSFLLLCLFIYACGTKVQNTITLDDSDKIIIGVLYFERNTNRQDLEPYRTGLTDMFISKLQKMEHIKVVERSKLDNIMSEMELNDLGVIDPDTAQKIGRLMGAQALYYGSFTSPLGEQLCLDGRLVRVETGEVISAGQNICPINDKALFDTVDKVSKIIEKQINYRYKELIADNFYSKGRTSEENNDKSGAIAYYNKALQYYPDHKLSQERLKALR